MSIRTSALALFSDMIQAVQKRTDLKAVILFGSRARGTPNKYSDYDLVLIGDFKEKFAERRDWVRKLAPLVSMDLFCYTPREFEQMFHSYRLTAIDAIGEGIVLHGEDFVAPFKQKYAEYVDRGMRKTSCALIPPSV
jgi:predicted nucleotidyltransferase